MEEIWKDVEEYEGLYQVSNLGNVKSLNYKKSGKSKLLKPSTDKQGYKHVFLCMNGCQKQYSIHRLVAKAFCEGYFEGAVVNHKDENKQNNIWTNLEWCTHQYNIQYSVNRKLGLIDKDYKYLTKNMINDSHHRSLLKQLLKDIPFYSIDELSKEINDTLIELKHTERNTNMYIVLTVYLRELKIEKNFIKSFYI